MEPLDKSILIRLPCYMLLTDSKIRLFSLVDVRMALDWGYEILVELPVTIH